MSATFAGLKSQILQHMEALENEIIALRCVTGLLNGQSPGACGIELSELSYIIVPIIEREKVILDDIRSMFKEVGFKTAD